MPNTTLLNIWANATPFGGVTVGKPISSSPPPKTITQPKPSPTPGFSILAPNPRTGALQYYSFGGVDQSTSQSVSPLSVPRYTRQNIVPGAVSKTPSVPPPTPDPFAGIGATFIKDLQGVFSGFQNYVAGNLETYGIGNGSGAPSGTNVPTGTDSPTKPSEINGDFGTSTPSPQIPSVPPSPGPSTTDGLFSTSSLKSMGPILFALAVFVIIILVVKKK